MEANQTHTEKKKRKENEYTFNQSHSKYLLLGPIEKAFP
jgi:hypothetical protein